MQTKVRDKRLLAEVSDWHGDSQVRVRAYRIVHSDKIIIDVTELSHHRMCREGTALRLARKLARQVGAASVDAVKLSDFRADKKVSDIEGVYQIVKMRHTYFAFHGANS